ncbi:MAG: hypothetical protein C5B50_26145 [Verrucomicrobia bacterium]|nr:MAG: hypothetical protein C5B50_26145 [Verrucomicrobiota bacterium]
MPRSCGAVLPRTRTINCTWSASVFIRSWKFQIPFANLFALNRRNTALLAGLVILALAFTALFSRLGHYALWDDEAGTALSAIGIWRTGDTAALLDHNIVAYERGKDLRNLRERLMPPLPGYLAAPFIGLLGRNAWAARLPFALCGALCVALMLWWVFRDPACSSSSSSSSSSCSEENTDPPHISLVFFGVALLTNVSFFLFCRQCRYYAPAMLTSVALAWLYVQSAKSEIRNPKSEITDQSRDREGALRGESKDEIQAPKSEDQARSLKKRCLILFSFLSICLFASNYLNWAAFWVCLGVDYLILGRKQIQLRWPDWLILFLPQVMVCGFIFLTWNPFKILASTESYPVVGKALHLWWCARDVVTCEFVCPVLVALGLLLAISRGSRVEGLGTTRDEGRGALSTGPDHLSTGEGCRNACWSFTFYVSRFTHLSRRNSAKADHATRNTQHAIRNTFHPWLPRACLCLIIYVITVSLLVPKPPSLRGVAAVRYFTPIIPLSIAISTMALSALYVRSRLAAVALAITAFSSSLFNGGPFLSTGLQSSQFKFLQELITPPGDPYSVAAQWIEKNVADKESLWVMPDFATYPLMYHAPAPTYAWQLDWPPTKEEFRRLDPSYFFWRVPPKYIIAFGPATDLVRQALASWNRPELAYKQIATIDYYWREMHRPELFWRAFRPITQFDHSTEAIFIFRLQEP